MLHRVAYLPHIFDLQFLFHRLCVTINMQINIYLEMLLLNTSFLLSQTVPLRASWLLFKTYLFYGVYQFSNLKLTSHKIILSRTLKLINHMQPHTEQYQRIQCVMAYFYKTSFQIRQFTSCQDNTITIFSLIMFSRILFPLFNIVPTWVWWGFVISG